MGGRKTVDCRSPVGDDPAHLWRRRWTSGMDSWDEAQRRELPPESLSGDQKEGGHPLSFSRHPPAQPH